MSPNRLFAMKTYLALTLGLACFITTSSLSTAADMVRAAVIAKDVNAELRTTDSARSAGRESFNAGEVHEIVATVGRYEQLKIDDTHVALVPTSSLRIRECTRSEFTEAQTKFKVLEAKEYRDARKDLSEKKKEAVAKASAGTCATCPKIRAAAQEKMSEANTAYKEKSRELRLKIKNLTKEALEWAATKS